MVQNLVMVVASAFGSDPAIVWAFAAQHPPIITASRDLPTIRSVPNVGAVVREFRMTEQQANQGGGKGIADAPRRTGVAAPLVYSNGGGTVSYFPVQARPAPFVQMFSAPVRSIGRACST